MFASPSQIYPDLGKAIMELWDLSIFFLLMYGVGFQWASTCFYPLDETPWFLKWQYAFHPFLRKWHKAFRPLYTATGIAALPILFSFRYLELSEIWYAVGASEVTKAMTVILSLQALYLAVEAFWPRRLGILGMRIAQALGVSGNKRVELAIRVAFFLMAIPLQAMPHVSYLNDG